MCKILSTYQKLFCPNISIRIPVCIQDEALIRSEKTVQDLEKRSGSLPVCWQGHKFSVLSSATSTSCSPPTLGFGCWASFSSLREWPRMDSPISTSVLTINSRLRLFSFEIGVLLCLYGSQFGILSSTADVQLRVFLQAEDKLALCKNRNRRTLRERRP